MLHAAEDAPFASPNSFKTVQIAEFLAAAAISQGVFSSAFFPIVRAVFFSSSAATKFIKALTVSIRLASTALCSTFVFCNVSAKMLAPLANNNSTISVFPLIAAQ